MDCVYTMGNLRIVDLTKTLDPKTETRRCHLYRASTQADLFLIIIQSWTSPATSAHTANARIIMMTTGQVLRKFLSLSSWDVRFT